LLAGLVDVRVVDGLVGVEGALLDAVRVAFPDGEALSVGAVVAGRRAASWSVGRPPRVISAARRTRVVFAGEIRGEHRGEQLSGRTGTTGTTDWHG
jgi:hypothetical protein